MVEEETDVEEAMEMVEEEAREMVEKAKKKVEVEWVSQ